MIKVKKHNKHIKERLSSKSVVAVGIFLCVSIALYIRVVLPYDAIFDAVVITRQDAESAQPEHDPDRARPVTDRVHHHTDFNANS